MDDNNLLMIVLAFVVGFMLPGMMNNMCGVRLIEGKRRYHPGGTPISGQVIDNAKESNIPRGNAFSNVKKRICSKLKDDLYNMPNDYKIHSNDFLNKLAEYEINCLKV